MSELDKDLTDEERNMVLARWERQGRLTCRTIIGGAEKYKDGTFTGLSQKTRQYLVRGEVVYEHDGRQPYPTPEQFATICLAVMACS